MQTASVNTPQPHAAPGRILLAEDNHTNRKVALGQLKKMGHTADVAGNGREALAVWQGGRYDLVLMDCQMPDMDGFETARQIRQLEKGTDRRTIIIAVTANAMHGDRERCLEAGMDDYLAKPIRMRELRAALEKWGWRTRENEDVEAPPGTEDSPVDLRPLNAFAQKDDALFRDLVEGYLSETAAQLEEMKGALERADGHRLTEAAHSCAGSSAACGMRAILPPLKALEAAAQRGDWPATLLLWQDATKELGRIRNYFEQRGER